MTEIPDDQRVDNNEEQEDHNTLVAEQISNSVDFYVGNDDIPYAAWRMGSKRVMWPVESPIFMHHIQTTYRRHRGRIPSQFATKSIYGWLENEAMAVGKSIIPMVRIKQSSNGLWYNMCDEQWRAIRLDGDGWEIVDRIPSNIPQIMANNAQKYVTPDPSGDINLLRKHIGGDQLSDTNWALIVGFLLSSMREEKEYPILSISGVQGSGKTTISNLLLSLIDPHHDTAATFPQSEEDIAVAARSRHVLAYDNLSGLKKDMSDSLCKLATGLTVMKRALYTKHGLNQYTVTRPLILNGIPDIVEKGDLARRVMAIYLDDSPFKDPKTIKNIIQNFEKDKAKILGGIFNVLVHCYRNHENVNLGEISGFKSVAEWVEGGAEALGWEKGYFLDVYNNNRIASATNVIDVDPFAKALIEVISEKKMFEGTYDEFIQMCYTVKNYNRKIFPPNVKWLLDNLRRLKPALKQYDIRILGLDKGEGRVWRTTCKRRFRKFRIEMVD